MKQSFQEEIEIEIKAGQTIVLDITAKKGPVLPQNPAPDDFGAVEFLLFDENEDPIEIPAVYLVNEEKTGYYLVDLKESKGRLKATGLIPGEYDILLKKPEGMTLIESKAVSPEQVPEEPLPTPKPTPSSTLVDETKISKEDYIYKNINEILGESTVRNDNNQSGDIWGPPEEVEKRGDVKKRQADETGVNKYYQIPYFYNAYLPVSRIKNGLFKFSGRINVYKRGIIDEKSPYSYRYVETDLFSSESISFAGFEIGAAKPNQFEFKSIHEGTGDYSTVNDGGRNLEFKNLPKKQYVFRDGVDEPLKDNQLPGDIESSKIDVIVGQKFKFYFDSKDFKLKASEQVRFDQLIDLFKNNKRIDQIAITGYTDADDFDNQKLSENRANEFKSQIEKNNGGAFTINNFVIEGKGVDESDQPEKHLRRRVEVAVIWDWDHGAVKSKN